MSRKIVGVTVGTPIKPSKVLSGYATEQFVNDAVDQVDRKVETLRGVVSKFHSNIVEEAKGETIRLSDASDMELAGLKLYGKTIQNGTPSPAAPVPLDTVGADGTVTVTVCGKNLLKNGYSNDQLFASGTVQYRYLEDGRFTLDGTAAINSIVPFLPSHMNYNDSNLGQAETLFVLKKGQTCYMSGIQLICRKVSDGSFVGVTTSIYVASASKQVSYTAPEDLEVVQFRAYIKSGTTYTADVIWEPTFSFVPMSAYEPYNGSTLSFATPNGLPGIHVSSGGNYTDEIGQQWICDEVDFEKGLYIQNVYKERLTKATGLVQYTGIVCTPTYLPYYSYGQTNEQMCSHLEMVTYSELANKSGCAIYNLNGNGYCSLKCDAFNTLDSGNTWLSNNEVYVVYRLLNPIVRELTAEDKAAYEALHTNYPNTTVFNDAGAHMDVRYVADTKIYIDNKFAALSAAILST